MKQWYDSLARLTGEELFHLSCKLTEWMVATQGARDGRKITRRHRLAIQDVLVELAELQVDVAAQTARITIPMIEAQGIVWRARFARGHPVRMVPQD